MLKSVSYLFLSKKYRIQRNFFCCTHEVNGFWNTPGPFVSLPFRPFICLSVCLFVRFSEVFLRNHSQKFFNFAQDVRMSSTKFSSFFLFFEKDHNKRILGAERALNGPKMRFSNFMKNLTHGISVFWRFCI